MAVVRNTYGVVSASTTIVTHTSEAVDLPRPSDAAETNTLDWVTRPAFRKEFESGRAVVKANSTFGVAGMLLTKIEVVALQPFNSLAPIDLSFSQFPSPPVAGAASVLRTILDVTDDPTVSIFVMTTSNGDFTYIPTKDLLSSILLRADEFLRITLYNSTGGDITGLLEARYDFGLNSGNYGSIPLLI